MPHNINPRTVKACLFDLDGVLVDTAVYHYKAWKRLANSLDFDFTEEQNEQLKGVSRMDSLKLILGWGKVNKSAAEMTELAARKNSWYVEMISKMTEEEVLPGVLDFLKSLQAEGIKMALGSASKNSGLILERTGLAYFFNVLVDGNAVTSSKPDPEVFLKAAELLHVSPQNCVVFEDAIAGIQAAVAARMKVVGIGSPDVLRADLVISGLGKMTLEKLKSL